MDVDWIHVAQDRLVEGSHEHGNEPSGLIQGGAFLDWLGNYQPMKKYSAQWSLLLSG